MENSCKNSCGTSGITPPGQSMHLLNRNSLRWVRLGSLKELGPSMSALKILNWLKILLYVKLYLSFKPRKKNKSMPVGKIKSLSFSPLPSIPLALFNLYEICKKNCNRKFIWQKLQWCAQENTQEAFSFRCSRNELSDQPSGLKCDTVNKDTSSFLWCRRAVGCNSHYSKARIFH